MPTRLDLVFAQEDALALDLLKSDVCRGQIVVVNRILIQRVHWRMRA